MRTNGLVTLLFLFAIPNPGSAQGDKKPGDKLQGVWSATNSKFGDTVFSVDDGKHLMTFSGDKFNYKSPKSSFEGTFKVGAMGKLKTVDFTREVKGKTKTQLAIYQIKGDELTICFAVEGKTDRLTAFVSQKDGVKYELMTYKRQKSK